MFTFFDSKSGGFGIAEFHPNETNQHKKLTIKPGSQFPKIIEEQEGSIKNKCEELISSGDIVLRNDYYIVLNGITLSHSMGAALVMAGNPATGKIRWTDIQTGKLLGEIYPD